MAGKGSKPRPTDIKKFDPNFDEINWNSKKVICTIRQKPCDGSCAKHFNDNVDRELPDNTLGG